MKVKDRSIGYPNFLQMAKLYWHGLICFHDIYYHYGNGINSDPSRITYACCNTCKKKDN